MPNRLLACADVLAKLTVVNETADKARCFFDFEKTRANCCASFICFWLSALFLFFGLLGRFASRQRHALCARYRTWDGTDCELFMEKRNEGFAVLLIGEYSSQLNGGPLLRSITDPLRTIKLSWCYRVRVGGVHLAARHLDFCD